MKFAIFRLQTSFDNEYENYFRKLSASISLVNELSKDNAGCS